MKKIVNIVNEIVKVALLSAIVVFMAMNVDVLQKPKSNESVLNKAPKIVELNEEAKGDFKQRENLLKKIMEHSVSQVFKFPGSVKFQDINFEYKRIFHDHGINIDTEKELEFASMCGQYSAQNAMAIYGPSRPFYGEIAVNNEEKGISGEVWIEFDGEIKKLISLDSTVMLDGDREEFEKLYKANCGDIDNLFMGVFSQYEIGYAALSVKYYLKELDNLSKYPEAKESLSKCTFSGASHDYCIGTEICKREKELDKVIAEFCALKNQVCSVKDKETDCEAKLETAYKAKKSSKK